MLKHNIHTNNCQDQVLKKLSAACKPPILLLRLVINKFNLGFKPRASLASGGRHVLFEKFLPDTFGVYSKLSFAHEIINNLNG